MRALPLALLALSSALLPGCVARTLVDVATAPVKVVSKGVDLATTSQSEADEKRGRELRKREEHLGELQRDYDRQSAKCRDGDETACNAARQTYAEIQQVLPTVPVDPQPR